MTFEAFNDTLLGYKNILILNLSVVSAFTYGFSQHKTLKQIFFFLKILS